MSGHRQRHASLGPIPLARMREMVATLGVDKTADRLQAGPNTIEELTSGGFSTARTVKRITDLLAAPGLAKCELNGKKEATGT